jgi:YtcA family
MHCFSMNILGTFFPSWMLCALLGIAGAAAAFKILSGRHVVRWLQPALLLYPSIATVLASLIWLGWYGH